jgi:peptidoglycan/LPS O-acetylase OafA/YrhL
VTAAAVELPEHERSSGRIQSIHLLRGLAALMVAWAHLGPYFVASAGLHSRAVDVWRRTVADPLHLYQDAGHLGVVIFFLVSGYIITHVSLRETVGTFAVRRVLRIFPVLLLALLLVAVVEAAARSAGLPRMPGLEADSFRSYLTTFFLSNWWSGEPYALRMTWTLQVEILFYVLTAMFLVMTRRRPLASTWWLAGAWVAGTAIVLGLPWAYRIQHDTVYVAFLVLGRLIYFVHTRRTTLGESAPLFAAVAVAFVLLETKAFPGLLAEPQHGAASSYAIALIAFVACLQLAPDSLPRPLRFTGDISYSMYLFHVPVGMLTLFWTTSHGLRFSVAFVVAIAAVVAASWASYRLVERPSQKLARALTSHRPKSALAPSAAPARASITAGPHDERAPASVQAQLH